MSEPTESTVEQLEENTEQSSFNEAKVREVEPGENVSFSLGFDKKMLVKLMREPEALLDEQSWDKEAKAERLRTVLDIYTKLPEKLNFEAGITAIFGENGSGKTLLADSLTMALQMELYREEHGISFGTRIHGGHSSGRFLPSLPGRLDSSGNFDYSQQQRQREHSGLVAGIAECIRVHEAAVFSKDTTRDFSAAHRSSAALGNVVMGMSTRQTLDYLADMDSSRQFRATDKPSSIVIYDEPEMGMSPRRQRHLVEELTGRSKGAVELVPSNSIVLFESNVPRIDLDAPEMGIYTPES